MLQAPENYVLVEIDKKFQDETGGIIIDPTWHPEEHATLEGIVVSAPVRINSEEPILGKVQAGDRIFFSYSVVFAYALQPDDDTPVYKNLVIHEGREYWKVDVAEIFCKVKDGKIDMLTDHLLLTPVFEKDMYDKEVRGVGKIVGMPEKQISCEVGDTIGFEGRFAQEYNILGKTHYIIPGRRVIAKWI